MGDLRQRRRGDKRVGELKNPVAQRLKLAGAARIGGEEPFVPAPGIVSDVRGGGLVHQEADEILPGGRLLFDIVNQQMAEALAEIVGEHLMMHQLRVENAHGEGQVEQAVLAAAAAEGAGGFRGVGEVHQPFRLAAPGGALAVDCLVQAEAVQGGAVERVQQLADDLLRAQAQVGERPSASIGVMIRHICSCARS
jgi:hypothetical protein